MTNYRDLYTEMHKRRDNFIGYSILPHVADIAALVERHRSKSLLDFGCGKGHQYTVERVHDAWGGIMPTLYDPGVPELAKHPKKKFDGVICTDVMEHIELCDVRDVLRDVFRHANHWVFFSICTRPAKKELPDGRNVHLTVKPKYWWEERVKKAAKGAAHRIVFV